MMQSLLYSRAKIVHANIWKDLKLVPELDDDADEYDEAKNNTDQIKKYNRSVETIAWLLKNNPLYLRDPYFQPHASTKFLDSYFSTLLNVDMEMIAEFQNIADDLDIGPYTNLKEIHIQYDYFIDLR